MGWLMSSYFHKQSSQGSDGHTTPSCHDLHKTRWAHADWGRTLCNAMARSTNDQGTPGTTQSAVNVDQAKAVQEALGDLVEALQPAVADALANDGEDHLLQPCLCALWRL